jgi:hypothetical protein
VSNSKISALTSATTPLAGTETLPVVQSSTTKQVSVANLTAGRAVATGALTVTGTITGSDNVSISSSSTDGSVNYKVTNTSNSSYVTTNVMGSTGYGFANWANSSVIEAVPASTGGLVIDAYTGKIYLQVGRANIATIGSSDVTLSIGNLVQGTAAKGVNFTANTPLAGKTSQLLNWYEEGTWTPTAVPGAGAITTYASGGTYTRVGRQVTVTAYVDLTNVGTASGALQISNLPFKNGAMSGAGYLQQMGIARETGVTGVNYGCVIAGGSPFTSIYVTSLTGGSILWVNTYQYALSITYYTA